jgi:uncharacterized protein (UPF0333 family)
MNNRGQLSTEYLVILAVVVIVALIVVTVLGGFIDIGGGAATQAAKAYWRGADIGLLNWKVVSSGTSTFVARNNQDYTIQITQLSVGGQNLLAGTSSSYVMVTAGKTASLMGTLSSPCTDGQSYSLPMVFTYNDVQHNINGLTFTGVKNLEGVC